MSKDKNSSMSWLWLQEAMTNSHIRFSNKKQERRFKNICRLLDGVWDKVPTSVPSMRMQFGSNSKAIAISIKADMIWICSELRQLSKKYFVTIEATADGMLEIHILFFDAVQSIE